MLRFLQSTLYAVEGLLYALRTERNVQIWFGILIANLLVAWWLEVTKIEFLIIFMTTCSIGISEYLNTSIERLSDRVTTEREETIKRVKDMAAGATFVASICTAVVSAVIYIPLILDKF